MIGTPRHRDLYFQGNLKLGKLILVHWLLPTLLAIEITYVAILSLGRPLKYWDSWVTWAMKGRVIFLDGYISPGVFSDPSRMVTHLDYPLLVPLIEAWTFFWGLSGSDFTRFDDRLAGIQAVLFFVSLLGICYTALRRLGAGDTLSLAATVLIGSMANVYALASMVFADVPLAVYVTIAAVYTIIWLEAKSPGALMVAALAAGLMPWAKREGLMLLPALCLALLITVRFRRPAIVASVAFILAAGMLSGPWWAFVALNGIFNAAFLPLTVANFQGNLARVPNIARLMLAGLLGPGWNYFWPALALTATSIVSKGWRPVNLLPLTAAFYLSAVAMGFVLSDFVPYQQHVVSSIDRLIVHVVTLALLWVALRGTGD